MRSFTFLPLLLPFASLCLANPVTDSPPAPARSNDEAGTVVATLQGRWVCVWDQRDGRVDQRQIGTVFVFDGTVMTHAFPDGHSSRWEFRLHPETQPKGIDWRLLRETRPTDFEPSIFWLSGDTFVFCDGFPIDTRPEHFGDAPHLCVLRRVDLPNAPKSDIARPDRDTKTQIGIQENAWVDTHEFVVSAKSNKESPVATKIRLQEGEVFIIAPDKEAKWGAHGSNGPLADYRGLGRTDSLLSLFFRVGEASAPVIAGRPITVISPGELELYCQDNEPWNNVGKVALTVIRLKTNK